MTALYSLPLHLLVTGGALAALLFSFLFLKTFFTISALAWSDALILIVFLALAGPAMRQMHALTDHLGKLLQRVAQAPKKKTRKA